MFWDQNKLSSIDSICDSNFIYRTALILGVYGTEHSGDVTVAIINPSHNV